MEKIATDIELINSDKSVVIDTAELYSLLDSAKKENLIKIGCLTTIVKEYDNEIKYKDKVLYAAKLLQSAYNNEFKLTIVILGSTTENRIQLLNKRAVPKMKKISNAQHEVDKANKQMREKYKIDLGDFIIN